MLAALDAVVQADRRRTCSRIFARQLHDVFFRDAGQRRNALGMIGADALAQFLKTVGVTGDVIRIMQFFADDDVHQAQREREIAAGINPQMTIGQRRGARPDRIDHPQFRAVASRLDDEGPQVNVGPVNIRAPRRRSTSRGGIVPARFRSGNPRGRQSPPLPADEQMVRSRRDAPRRWKNRRSMPLPLSNPMVPGVAVGQNRFGAEFLRDRVKSRRQSYRALRPRRFASKRPSPFAPTRFCGYRSRCGDIFALQILRDFPAQKPPRNRMIGIAAQTGRPAVLDMHQQRARVRTIESADRMANLHTRKNTKSATSGIGSSRL